MSICPSSQNPAFSSLPCSGRPVTASVCQASFRKTGRDQSKDKVPIPVLISASRAPENESALSGSGREERKKNRPTWRCQCHNTSPQYKSTTFLLLPAPPESPARVKSQPAGKRIDRQKDDPHLCVQMHRAHRGTSAALSTKAARAPLGFLQSSCRLGWEGRVLSG